MLGGWAGAGERGTDGSTRVGRQAGGGRSGASRADFEGGHVPGHAERRHRPGYSRLAEHRCPIGDRGAGAVLPLERRAVRRSLRVGREVSICTTGLDRKWSRPSRKGEGDGRARKKEEEAEVRRKGRSSSKRSPRIGRLRQVWSRQTCRSSI